MNHKDAFELLPWYVNGTLEEGDDARVAKHLKACRLCRKEADKLHKLEGLVRASCEQELEPPAQSWRSRLEGEGLPPQSLVRFPKAPESGSQPPGSAPQTAIPAAAPPIENRAGWKQVMAIPLAASAVILLGIVLFQSLPSSQNQSMSSFSFETLQPSVRGEPPTIEIGPKGEKLNLRLILQERASRYRCDLHFRQIESPPLLQEYFERAPNRDLGVSIPVNLLQEGSYWLRVHWESGSDPEFEDFQFHIQYK